MSRTRIITVRRPFYKVIYRSKGKGRGKRAIEIFVFKSVKMRIPGDEALA